MNSSFDRKEGEETWLTPPYIFKSLGVFDLDPCAAIGQPWKTAITHINEIEDGLIQKWWGRVWMNPPYGSKTKHWMKKLKEHGDGVALIFARTETRVWHDHIWNGADAVFFFKGRIKFHTIKGEQAGPAGAPSALVAYGERNVRSIEQSDLNGVLIKLEKK